MALLGREKAMHLWEVKHPYYCNEGNFFASESVGSEFKSWAKFIEEFGDADMDMNLLFRWDWREGEEYGLGPFTGDVNYRNGRLLVFWMGQRKGLYQYSTVEVCRADESAVIEYLRPRWEHMRLLWEPLGSNVK
jgi:hypothetical protein